jgi:aspartate kinase
LVKTLESAQHLEEVSFRAENKIISKGEKLAARYMAALLNDRGIPAQFVDLSDIVRKHDLSASRDGFYGELAQAFGLEILSCGDKVPVLTGYFAHPEGLLNSIGRGYTDLCAALVAVGLNARELQIWKEIDGIFTGDPRKIPTARLIPFVSPAEAAELTFYGSEVIHPFTMDQAIRERIPIRIKNVMNPRGSGTVIIPDPENTAVDPLGPRKVFRTRSSLSVTASKFKPKRPTAVTTKRNIVVINVHSSRRTRAHGFLIRIFGIIDKWNLSVDLIASSEVHVSMACHISRGLVQGSITPNGGGGGSDTEEELKIEDERLDGAVTDLADLGTVDLAFGMAIVSLVGKDLRNMTGISGRFFSVLGNNNINIEMISQGDLDFYSSVMGSANSLKRGIGDQYILRYLGTRCRSRNERLAHRSLHVSRVIRAKLDCFMSAIYDGRKLG